ncbi:hypothetical protein [Roseisolibacter sp. H3M3-2]|uniref:hypothetical protein n=1 Tax=Roseisolibacter sp. H3M3-2 TaxID=3031323 RepID=UPI0023DBBEB2|nr:hypothetical protein [Roseisolibacter sp. H3M3-2]MDF1505323.1 hypothetical protein [Roseisolibacter sp. H3M3-2]
MPPRRPPAAALAAGLLLAAPVGATPLGAQDAAPRDVRSLAPTRVAAQVGAGALLTPVGFVTLGVLTDTFFERLGRDDATTSAISLGAAYAGGARGAAAGPALIGARGPGRGRFVAAVVGAAAGGLASWALVRLVDRDDDDDDRPPRGGRVVAAVAGAAVFLLPSVGATVGYNLSRRP